MSADKLLLTIQEACAAVGVCRTVGYKLAASGRWPVVRIGRSVRIPADALRKWVEQNTQEPQS